MTEREKDLAELERHMADYLGFLNRNDSFPFSDAMRRQLPAMLAALRFVEEHGWVLRGALSEAADRSEGGLFPGHAARLDAAHAALSRIQPPRATGDERP